MNKLGSDESIVALSRLGSLISRMRYFITDDQPMESGLKSDGFYLRSLMAGIVARSTLAVTISEPAYGQQKIHNSSHNGLNLRQDTSLPRELRATE